MLGKRLNEANKIAQKRVRKLMWGNNVPLGFFRKSNGSCSCVMCRGEKYKAKGFYKRRNISISGE